MTSIGGVLSSMGREPVGGKPLKSVMRLPSFIFDFRAQIEGAGSRSDVSRVNIV